LHPIFFFQAEDGIRGFHVTEFRRVLFRSDPQQLTLRLGEIEALPKGEDYIEIDFEQQKILYQPSSLQGELSVTKDSISYVGSSELNEQYKGSLFSTGIDVNGEEVYMRFGSMHSGSEYETLHRFDLEGFTNPIRFPIVSYPNFLPGSIEVDIPLVSQ